MKKSFIKKMVLIVIAVIISASVIIGVCFYIGIDKVFAYFSVFSFSDEFENDDMPMSLKNFDGLNQKEKQAYISVYNSIESHPEYIKIPMLSSDEFNNVFFAVKNDNPDMLCFAESCNMIKFMSACFLQLHYEYDVETCNNMTKTLDTVANRIVNEMTAVSDYEKELYIHDYIVSSCRYTESDNSSSAYGCLVDGEAVCSGYSRAAMLLLKKAGVDSMLVAGTGITQTEGEISHMWNIVWLDGEPYHLDVTWDDPVADDKDAVSHLYFNLSNDVIATDHKDLSADVDCSYFEYNYFAYEGLLFDEYNAAALDEICLKLSENINNETYSVEISFSTIDAYNTAVANIVDNVSPNSDMYFIIDYLSENVGDRIDVSHVNFTKEDSKRYIRLLFDAS